MIKRTLGDPFGCIKPLYAISLNFACDFSMDPIAKAVTFSCHTTASATVFVPLFFLENGSLDQYYIFLVL